MNLAQVIQTLCRRVISEKDELTRLDQAVGDGDLGVNADRGARAILSSLNDFPTSDESALLDHVARALNGAGCGTSGTLISFGIMAGAARTDSLSGFLEAALAKIAVLGRAHPGEKTLIDALLPATETYLATGSLVQAAQAASAGAERTAEMTGTKGRALYSQSRSRGYPDPGAYLVASLFDQASRCVKELDHEEAD